MKLDKVLIEETSINGYFIDNDTAKLIGQFLDDYHEILHSRTRDDLDNDIKNETLSNRVLVEEICGKLGVDGYEFS